MGIWTVCQNGKHFSGFAAKNLGSRGVLRDLLLFAARSRRSIAREEQVLHIRTLSPVTGTEVVGLTTAIRIASFAFRNAGPRVRSDPDLKTSCHGLTALGLAAVFLGPVPSTAQLRAFDEPLFLKLGSGSPNAIVGYPLQNTGYPSEFQEFARGFDIPITDPAEPGDRFLLVSAVAGAPSKEGDLTAGYAGRRDRQGSYRFTLQPFNRYIFGTDNRGVAPYVVLDNPGQSIAPSVDDVHPGERFGRLNIELGLFIGGVNTPLSSSFSVLIESRYSLASPSDPVYTSSTIGTPSSGLSNQVPGQVTLPREATLGIPPREAALAHSTPPKTLLPA